MKRTILTGILALACVATLMAQTPSAPAGQAGAPPAAAGQAAPAAPAGPHPKSPEEGAAMQALITAQRSNDPDAIIKAAEDVLTRFADTDYKEVCLTLEGMAYGVKGDAVKEEVVWQRVLGVDPNSIAANLSLASLIAKQTKDKDLDRDEQLAKGAKYANTAIAGIKAQMGVANPNLQAQLKINDAEGHEDLALMAITKATANKDTDPKKFDPAIAEMRTAADEDPQPTYSARLAYTLELAGKHAEALDLSNKILALPNLNPAIKQFATSVHDAAQKNAGAPAAK